MTSCEATTKGLDSFPTRTTPTTASPARLSPPCHASRMEVFYGMLRLPISWGEAVTATRMGVMSNTICNIYDDGVPVGGYLHAKKCLETSDPYVSDKIR